MVGHNIIDLFQRVIHWKKNSSEASWRLLAQSQKWNLNIKDTRTTALTLFWCIYCEKWTR